ncbi:MAG: hypothetical protein H7263_10805 [Candidatus Sericytochromatia bacterium]|nr:hypothetical protein [Candidatus Sericytochromatia bacterium]
MNNDLVGNIKILIKSLYQLADKSSTGITIKSMHDSAQIISKMYGFNSWNELKQNLEYLKKDYTEDNPRTAKLNLFDEIRIKKGKFIIHSSMPLIPNQDMNLNEINLIQDVIVGKKTDKNLKTSNFVSLEAEDFVIISSVDNSHIIRSIRKQIIEFGHASIYLTSQSDIKLDPWSNIFENNGIEFLFKMKEYKNDFIMSWISTFRYLQHEVNFHPSVIQCLDSLYLEGIVQVYDWLKINKPNAAWYLQKYLDDIGLIENKNEYIISKEMQEIHWKNIAKEVETLEAMQKLYDDKVFEKNDTDILWNTLSQRKSIKIGLIENVFYKEFVTLELNRVAEQYQKQIKNKLTDNYKAWIFCDNLEAWETSNLLLLNDKDFLIKGYQTQGKSLNLINFLSKIDQIILGKMININLPHSIMDNMLNKTQIWEENIWFDDKKALKVLKKNEVYLWYAQKDLNKIKELRDFICEKIVSEVE